eukprot:1298270-Prymnesium_polylepis.1
MPRAAHCRMGKHGTAPKNARRFCKQSKKTGRVKDPAVHGTTKKKGSFSYVRRTKNSYTQAAEDVLSVRTWSDAEVP